jgi:hypothetical protein
VVVGLEGSGGEWSRRWSLTELIRAPPWGRCGAHSSRVYDQRTTVKRKERREQTDQGVSMVCLLLRRYVSLSLNQLPRWISYNNRKELSLVMYTGMRRVGSWIRSPSINIESNAVSINGPQSRHTLRFVIR